MQSQEKIKIEIIENNRISTYKADKGVTLLEALQELGIKMFSPCGGSGKCGKCKVLIEGEIGLPSLEEKALIPEEGIEKGWRLACKLVLNKDVKVYKPETAVGMNILHHVIGQKSKNIKSNIKGNNFGVAIDIGTTTVILYLVGLDSQEVIDIERKLNPQTAIGADVITRINYSINRTDGLDEMRNLIISCINEMLEAVVKRNKLNIQQVTKAVLSGNTTMIHIFSGLKIQGLGIYPYIPVTLEMSERTGKQTGLNVNPSGNVLTLPAISAFIGADIIAGILAVGMHKEEKQCLLIDLGTNGEMVIGNKKGMLACSAAMGPAFEGACTEFGTASISGAINSVSINKNGVFYNTIDNTSPIGICGSGIIDITAEMLEIGIIDNIGRFVDKDTINSKLELSMIKDRLISYKGKPAFITAWKSDGTPIVFTQQDVRQVQLAKSAIAAGIEFLINKAKINIKDIDKVYFAGGFGNFIDILSAIRIGLIPEKFRDKIILAGDTSGAGAIKVLINQESVRECIRIKEIISYLEIASDEDFQDKFINNLNF